MKKLEITQGLKAAFAGFIMSVTAAHAAPETVASAYYGSNGTGGVEIAAVERYNEKGALVSNFRLSKLDDDNYLRGLEIYYAHAFNERFIGMLGGGAILTDYSSSLQLDSLRPTVNIGGAVNIGGYVPTLMGYIYDAHNCGIKTTIPLYMYVFEGGKSLAVGLYAEANRIVVEKQTVYETSINSPVSYGTERDSETVRNIGLQVSFRY